MTADIGSSALIRPERIRPTHLCLPSGTVEERGRLRGERLRPLIHEAIRGYSGLFDELGIAERQQVGAAAASLEVLRCWDPLQHAEVVSVALAAGVTPIELMLVIARTEILAAAGQSQGECSALVALTPEGSAVGAQTWDWHLELSHLWHVNDVASGEGTVGHVGFAEAGMLAKIGVNAAGVGVMLNILANDGDRCGGVPVHAVLAAVLNRAMSLDEARSIIATAPTSASSTITVVAPQGAFVVEIGPHGKAELPVAGIAAHTNHFVADTLQKGARELSAETKSHERLSLLARRIDGMQGADSAAELTALLRTTDRDAPVSLIADFERPRWKRPATLVSVRMDAAARSVGVAAGSPSMIGAGSWISLHA